ncbi:MAG: hypothetical protein ACQEQ7_04575 [Thermodesulfobacteriota bacterium]
MSISQLDCHRFIRIEPFEGEGRLRSYSYPVTHGAEIQQLSPGRNSPLGQFYCDFIAVGIPFCLPFADRKASVCQLEDKPLFVQVLRTTGNKNQGLTVVDDQMEELVIGEIEF